MEPLIDFSNLSDSLSIKLEDSFRKELFDKFYLKFNNIRECVNYLGCSTSNFYKYKHQHCFIPIHIIRKMVQICDISVEETNKNILLIKKQNSKPVYTFSLYPSPELASIIGHAFGDGHISSGGRLQYVNKELG